jgi:hypothetical protein
MDRITVAFVALAALLAGTVSVPAQEEEVTPLPPVIVEEIPMVDPTPEVSPSAEAPSAEMIIDAEEKVLQEPAMDPDELPLPPMDGDAPFPGEENIFGDDLFGSPDTFMPSMPDIPEAPPLLEDPKELERKQRVKLRRIKARLGGDPELLTLQEMASRAPTPEDQRAARRAYYALFFDKVRKTDPGLAEYADRLEKSSVAGLYQTRIEPTLALNPPPQPQPQEKFIPEQQFPDFVTPDEEPIPLP